MHQRGALACNHNKAALGAATHSALLEAETICHGPLAGVKVLTGLCYMMKKQAKGGESYTIHLCVLSLYLIQRDKCNT